RKNSEFPLTCCRSSPLSFDYGVACDLLTGNYPPWILSANLLSTEMMRRLFVCAMLLAVPLAAYGEDKSKSGSRTPLPANSAFEKMKKLAGTWLAADEDGKPTDQVMSIIKVTAGGSAVHETIFPGQPQEMVSIYTVDGPDLVMTHYCVLGNQPRLKADPKS